MPTRCVYLWVFVHCPINRHSFASRITRFRIQKWNGCVIAVFTMCKRARYDAGQGKHKKEKNKVRRWLNDPKNGPCCKTLRRATHKRTEERTMRKRGTLMVLEAAEKISQNAGKFNARPCVEKEKKKKEKKSDSRSCFGLLGLLALGGSSALRRHGYYRLLRRSNGSRCTSHARRAPHSNSSP